MGVTSIEWTDKVWNVVRGCSRVSEGCRNCYAERMAARFSGREPTLPDVDPGADGPFFGFARMTPQGPRWTGRVELIPEKLDEPLRWLDARAKLGRPLRVFVNSMSDLFHEALPDEAIDRVFAVMAMCDGARTNGRHHVFQVLTKRPERMRAYFADPETPWRIQSEVVRVNVGYRPTIRPADEDGHRGLDTGQWPLPLPNVWLGVSVEDQRTADERIPLLLQTPAAKRFVSYEPAIGPADLSRWMWPVLEGWPAPYRSVREAREAGAKTTRSRQALVSAASVFLDWVIVGGESGPGARPFDLAWARSVVRQCREAGVPCFYKQGGASNRCEHSAKGGHFDCFPPDLRVREFPL